MHPILFQIHGFTLHTYGVLLMLGFALAVWRTAAAANSYPQKGVSAQDVLDLAFWVILGSLVCARIAFVFLEPDWRQLLPQIYAIWDGGISFDGGLFGGVLATVIFCRVRGISFFSMADLIAPSLILGYAVGRIGCFFNGCCYGRPTNLPWGVRFYADGDTSVLTPPSHPTQIYSSLMSLLIFALMIWREKSGRGFRGELFSWYFMGSAVERFVMEIWRGGVTSDYVHGTPFTTAQFFCMGLFVMGFIFWLVLRRAALPLAAPAPASVAAPPAETPQATTT